MGVGDGSSESNLHYLRAHALLDFAAGVEGKHSGGVRHPRLLRRTRVSNRRLAVLYGRITWLAPTTSMGDLTFLRSSFVGLTDLTLSCAAGVACRSQSGAAVAGEKLHRNACRPATAVKPSRSRRCRQLGCRAEAGPHQLQREVRRTRRRHVAVGASKLLLHIGTSNHPLDESRTQRIWPSLHIFEKGGSFVGGESFRENPQRARPGAVGRRVIRSEFGQFSID